MRIRPFGPLQVPLPVMGQGTFMMEKNREEAIQVLRTGIDLGATHIDTAEMYGSGAVEELVGEAIRDIRDRVFLVSKVLPSNASFEGTIEACERSLKKLGTDRLECYLLHWRGDHPLEETFRAFDHLVQDGKIRTYGVSNFDLKDMKEAVSVAGKDKILCNQVLYHIAERSIEHDLLPWCTQNRIALVAYSPLGQGNFPSPESPGGKVLAAIGKCHNATPEQVAIAFLIHGENIFVIPKSSREKHLRENIASASLELTPKEITELDQAFPKGTTRSLPTL
ncbi:MAG: aldo/keto reductase [Planctomycetota bacterium]|nr:aldo/keto reductase [Planctomycetota bacterium]